MRAAPGKVALFGHGHLFRVLVARWIGLPVGAGEHFLLDTASLSILRYYHESPAVKIWNASPHAMKGDRRDDQHP